MPTYNFTCEVCGKKGRAYRSGGPPRFCSNRCKGHGLYLGGKTVKHVVTPEAAERIRALYQSPPKKNGVSDLARKLGLPRWKVTRWAIQEGLIAKTSKAPQWSPEEEAILREHAHRTPEILQRHLAAAGYRRTVTSIVLKRKRLELPSQLPGYSANAVAGALGEDIHFVTRAITAGRLAAERRGTARTERQGGDQWYIMPDAIRRFIRDNVEMIDFRKVNKFFVVDILTRPDPAVDIRTMVDTRVRELLGESRPAAIQNPEPEKTERTAPAREQTPIPDEREASDPPRRVNGKRIARRTKPTIEDRIEIRRLKKEGLSNKAIADRFHVHLLTVRKITAGMPAAKRKPAAKRPSPHTGPARQKTASAPQVPTNTQSAPVAIKLCPAPKPKTPRPATSSQHTLEKKIPPGYCQRCGIRKVPKKPINGVLLTRLCYQCWSGAGDPTDTGVRSYASI